MAKRNNLIIFSITGILFLILYFPTFIWMWERWMAKDSYYGHGILVPFISGFIAWQIFKNKKSAIEKDNPSNLGIAFIALGLATHLISAWMRVYFSSGFSMLFTISGLILYLKGRQTLKTLIFPILFLIFMLPLPLVAVANISFKMKILAANISTFLVNKIGIPAKVSGSMIYMRHSNLMVEDPCSGLRSLISLLALGSLFSHYLKASHLRKVVLLIASVPLALMSNITRITFLCFVSEVYGPEHAEGLVHDTAGMMVFVLAFLGMLVVSKILE